MLRNSEKLVNITKTPTCWLFHDVTGHGVFVFAPGV